MSAGLTPGPWVAQRAFNADDTHRIMWEERGQGWLRLRRLDRDTAGGYSPENARLIAAAPELYEAAQAALMFLENAYIPDTSGLSAESVVEALIAVLAKARGETVK